MSWKVNWIAAFIFDAVVAVFWFVTRSNTHLTFMWVSLFVSPLALFGVDRVKEFAEVKAKKVIAVTTAITIFATVSGLIGAAVRSKSTVVSIALGLAITVVISVAVVAARTAMKTSGLPEVSSSVSAALFGIGFAVVTAAVAVTVTLTSTDMNWVFVTSKQIGDNVKHPSVTDWMIAWGTLVAALGGLAGFVALLLEIVRRRSLRFRPPSTILDLLVDFSETLIEIINSNGQDSLWFLENSRRRNELLLTTLNGQIADRELNELVGKVLASYRKCFAFAPGSNMLRAPRSEDRILNQIDSAYEAQDFCNSAIQRVNYLVLLHGN